MCHQATDDMDMSTSYHHDDRIQTSIVRMQVRFELQIQAIEMPMQDLVVLNIFHVDNLCNIKTMLMTSQQMMVIDWMVRGILLATLTAASALPRCAPFKYAANAPFKSFSTPSPSSNVTPPFPNTPN
jgi:hypothetical protein